MAASSRNGETAPAAPAAPAPPPRLEPREIRTAQDGACLLDVLDVLDAGCVAINVAQPERPKEAGPGPARGPAGQGINFLRGMLAGRPALCGRQGSQTARYGTHPRVFGDFPTGLDFPPHQPQARARALRAPNPSAPRTLCP